MSIAALSQVQSAYAAASEGMTLSTMRPPSMAPSAAVGGAQATQGPSFVEAMGRAGSAALDTVRQGERAAIAGIEGTAGTQDVVQAVMAAEMTVETVVAIRDRMVTAYQEIMRMPI